MSNLPAWHFPQKQIDCRACMGWHMLCPYYVTSRRKWQLAFSAKCCEPISLSMNFREVVSAGGNRPAIAYRISQTANFVRTLFIVWIFFKYFLSDRLGLDPALYQQHKIYSDQNCQFRFPMNPELPLLHKKNYIYSKC